MRSRPGRRSSRAVVPNFVAGASSHATCCRSFRPDTAGFKRQAPLSPRRPAKSTLGYQNRPYRLELTFGLFAHRQTVWVCTGLLRGFGRDGGDGAPSELFNPELRPHWLCLRLVFPRRGRWSGCSERFCFARPPIRNALPYGAVDRKVLQEAFMAVEKDPRAEIPERRPGSGLVKTTASPLSVRSSRSLSLWLSAFTACLTWSATGAPAPAAQLRGQR